MKILAALFDLGDVIMQETTEVKDAGLATLRAELVPGIAGVLRELHARGIKLGLVADTHRKNPRNVLGQHGLYELFDAFAISEQVGCEKPDARIFKHALEKLNLAPRDYACVAMVGNNLERDVGGANALGLISIWFHWNNRYPIVPQSEIEKPRYTVQNTRELQELLERLDCER